MGKVSVRDYKDFDKKVCSLKEAQEWSEAIRYSPCEKFLANGTHDNIVYVYSISDDGQYTLYKSFNKHTSFVTALDWATDSSYVRSQCGAYEKLYFNIADKAHDSAGLTNTKDKEWATNTLKLGWDVQGIHPSGEDGSHINGVTVSKSAGLCASGDDWGLLNIYNYPVLDNSHEAVSYTGHSEHVTRAAFNADGTKLWTVGGQDKTLLQWKRK
jgi:microtubule-associated protein-like 1/2